jgi:phage-related protein
MVLKPIGWIGTSKSDLTDFPHEVVSEIGHALYIAQIGGKHTQAKVLSGFGSASVLEVIEDFHGDTFRAVYTVKFAEIVYVLHAFQKKSKKGIATSRNRKSQRPS